MKCDLHTHTAFSDGQATPAEMVLAAIEKGYTRLGFSDHSYTPFDESYCMKKGALAAYCAEIRALKADYAGKIELLCGLEQDFYAPPPSEPLDYIIGSVHYIKVGEDLLPVDESPADTRCAIEKYFGGDPYAYCECYFDTVSRVVEQTGADIIGHFDLVSKFEAESFFDPAHPRYRAAWQRAAEALLDTGKPFEINRGAVTKGYKTHPYPAPEMVEYITARGGKFLSSSDAHSTNEL